MEPRERRCKTKGITLLYVDDDEDTRGMVGRLLRNRYGNVNVIFAENGMDGLLKVELHRPQIVLIDLYMPYIDGFALAKKIISFFKESKVVVVSACSDNDKIRQCLSLDIHGYIKKPIDFNYFFNLLDNLMLQ